MLHQTHAGISWPALLVVVAHNILIIGVRVLCQVPLDQVLGLLSSEPEHDVHLQGKHTHNETQQNTQLADRRRSEQEVGKHTLACTVLSGT